MEHIQISVTPKMIINAIERLDYSGKKTRIEDIVETLVRNFPVCPTYYRLRREVSYKIRACIAAGFLSRYGRNLVPTFRGKRRTFYKGDMLVFWTVYNALANVHSKESDDVPESEPRLDNEAEAQESSET